MLHGSYRTKGEGEHCLDLYFFGAPFFLFLTIPAFPFLLLLAMGFWGADRWR